MQEEIKGNKMSISDYKEEAIRHLHTYLMLTEALENSCESTPEKLKLMQDNRKKASEAAKKYEDLYQTLKEKNEALLENMSWEKENLDLIWHKITSFNSHPAVTIEALEEILENKINISNYKEEARKHLYTYLMFTEAFENEKTPEHLKEFLQNSRKRASEAAKKFEDFYQILEKKNKVLLEKVNNMCWEKIPMEKLRKKASEAAKKSVVRY